MNSRIIGLLFVIPFLLPYLGGVKLPQPSSPSSSDGVPPGYEKLAESFAGNDDAIKWAGFLASLGQYVTEDGRTSQPQLKTMYDVLQLRDAGIKSAIEPISGGPEIGSFLGPKLAEAGTSNEPLDAARRKHVADIFFNAARALGG